MIPATDSASAALLPPIADTPAMDAALGRVAAAR